MIITCSADGSVAKGLWIFGGVSDFRMFAVVPKKLVSIRV